MNADTATQSTVLSHTKRPRIHPITVWPTQLVLIWIPNMRSYGHVGLDARNALNDLRARFTFIFFLHLWKWGKGDLKSPLVKLTNDPYALHGPP